MSPSEQHDKTAMYALSVGDLVKARCYLQHLHLEQPNTLRQAILEAAIIAYARPFTPNRYPHGKHYLASGVVPVDARQLHDEIIELRDRVIAHTDYEPVAPRVKSETMGTSISGTNTDTLDRFRERLPQLESLFGRTCDNLLREFKVQIAAFEAESKPNAHN